MPVTPTYPGVYIEEVPSGVHSITGVATAIAAFVDFFKRGPMNEAVEVFSFADFERVFGGLDTRSEASYAIQQFFLNGGSRAWVVRAASTSGGNSPTKASVRAEREGSGATKALEFSAINEGEWGNSLRARVDHATSDPTTLFNLTVSEVVIRESRAIVVASEEFRELSMDSTSDRFVETIVNSESALIRLDASGSLLPAPSGSITTGPTSPTVTGTSDKRVKVRFTYNDGGSPAFDERRREPRQRADRHDRRRRRPARGCLQARFTEQSCLGPGHRPCDGRPVAGAARSRATDQRRDVRERSRGHHDVRGAEASRERGRRGQRHELLARFGRRHSEANGGCGRQGRHPAGRHRLDRQRRSGATDRAARARQGRPLQHPLPAADLDGTGWHGRLRGRGVSIRR